MFCVKWSADRDWPTSSYPCTECDKKEVLERIFVPIRSELTL
jgi:hypothetical protein